MADIAENQQSSVTRIANPDETNHVEVNDLSELQVNDTTQQGTDTVLTLTTTAVELKVGGSALSDRKYILMEAREKNVMWGFNTSCNFSLAKSGFYILPLGENSTIYLKASTGTADVVIGEA